MNGSSSGNKRLYDLPLCIRKDLCHLLDQQEKWAELGLQHMGYNAGIVQEIRSCVKWGESPSDELLTRWGEQNHTVLELFILLSRMHHYKAMVLLKGLVDPKYHVLIHEGEQYLGRGRNFHKDMAVGSENFNSFAVLSKENNESLPVSKDGNLNESTALIPHIPYSDLEAATSNWSEGNVLGKGGFGVVYKGIWKRTAVAVKRLSGEEAQQLRQSQTELHWLYAYRHDNILPVYGCSWNGPQPCIVYQYMSNGSLEQKLRSQRPPGWGRRLDIARGVARGLHYLHTISDKPLIHGDIKSANILLDANDEAKIGDFGLAREGPSPSLTHVTLTRIHGTRPYLPDEFLRAKKMSIKVDVYSYGVVLFELATGLPAYSRGREEKLLKDLVLSRLESVDDEGAGLIDTRADQEEGSKEVFGRLIRVGRRCVEKRAGDRPEMGAVLTELEEEQLS